MHSKPDQALETVPVVSTVTSLAEQAYLVIRDHIVTLRLAPGSTIQEEGLAKALGFGRTPIREALIRLGQEGLVTVRPRRGTFVSDINITDLAQMTEIRLQMESFAAGLAAQRINAAESLVADTLLQAFAHPHAEQDPEHWIDLDRRVHYFMYRCTRNSFLEEDLVRYFNLSLRIWYLALDRMNHLHDNTYEHVELLRAIQAKDVELARQVIVRHIKNFEAEVRKVI